MLPDDQPLIHAEFTEFYRAHNPNDRFGTVKCIFGEGLVPPNCSHVLLTPALSTLDTKTLRWLHYIYQDVFRVLDLAELEGMPHTDVRLEMTMPKVRRAVVPTDGLL